MPERVAAGLGPDAEPVGARPTGIAARRWPVTRVDRVHDAVVAAAQPQGLAIGGDAAHVGAGRERQLPGLDDRLVLKLTTEIEPACRLETYRYWSLRRRIQPVGAGAGVQEALTLKVSGLISQMPPAT